MLLYMLNNVKWSGVFAALSTSAVLLLESLVPILRSRPVPSPYCWPNCTVSVTVLAALGCAFVAIRFVLLGVKSHMLQPLVQRHISILEIQPQLIHKLALF
jgi:hypothetical protein